MDAAELKKIRKDAGLTQADLADLLYVSVRAVSSWEQGINPISDKRAAHIREELNHSRVIFPFTQEQIDTIKRLWKSGGIITSGPVMVDTVEHGVITVFVDGGTDM